MNPNIIIAIVFAVLFAAFIFVLYLRGKISGEAIKPISGVLDSLSEKVDDGDEKDSFFENLIMYCSIAVDAVQQLVESGQFSREEFEDDEDFDLARLEKARELVYEYAAADGYNIIDDTEDGAEDCVRIEDSTVDSIIESQVYNTPHHKNDENA